MRYKIEKLTFYRVIDTEKGIVCHSHLSEEEAEEHIRELKAENE